MNGKGWYLFKEGFRNLRSNRMMTIASVGVLVACLLLTGTAVLFSLNITKAMDTIEDGSKATVFLKDETTTVEAGMIGDQILGLENIASCEFVDKDQALQSLLSRLGDDGTLYNGLFDDLVGSENFLPHSFKITFIDIERYKETLDAVKMINGVDHVTDYSEIAEKLTGLHRLVNTLGFWVVLVLGLVSLFIVANTIRVTMFSRRKEISIMKSVGATNGFIRTPFVIEGLVIGLISGILSVGLQLGCYTAIMRTVTNIIPFFTLIPFQDFLIWLIPAFIGSGCLLGVLGGVISISKYLKKEGGEIIAS